MLGDLGVALEVPGGAAGVADVVIAVIDRGDAALVLEQARCAGGDAPVVALLPLGGDALAAMARAAGAVACIERTAPLAALRAGVAAALAAPSARVA